MISGNQPDFAKGNGLVPAIIQHALSREVLMLGYMNEASYQMTNETGRVTFFSRSKNRLWVKGESSGNYLVVKDVSVDCDYDTILIQATPHGPTCHTGSDTCFNGPVGRGVGFLAHLGSTISARKSDPTSTSYTAGLFRDGIDRIAQKVGEEAIEVVIEAKNVSDDRLKGEAADLLFHLMVLLEQRGIALDDVCEVLRGRSR